MKTVKVFGRTSAYSLKEVYPGVYETNDPNRLIGNSIRFPEAIDFDGGPYISKGYKIEDNVVNQFVYTGKQILIICE